MATIGALNIFMNADATGVTKGFASAKKSAMSFQSTIGALKGGLAALGVGLGAIGVSRLIGFGAATLNAADDVGDLAERINTTTESLTQLQFAAKITGGSVESVAAAIQRMNKSLGEAAVGTAESRDAFLRLGLSVGELSAMDGGAAFDRIADAISRIPTVAGRAAAATRIFGKGAQELLPLLSRGSAGIAALRAEADRLGVTLSSSTSKEIGKAQDAVDKLSLAWEGLKRNLVGSAAPAIESTIDRITRVGVAARQSGVEASSLGSAFVKGVLPALSVLEMLGTAVDAVLPRAASSATAGAGNTGPQFTPIPRFLGTGAADTQAFITARTAALAAAARASQDLQVQAGELLGKLTMEAMTFGLSADEAELYRLRLSGATEATLVFVEGAIKQKKALEEAAKAREELNDKMSEGANITESLAADSQLRLASGATSRFDTGGGAIALDQAQARNAMGNDARMLKAQEEAVKKLEMAVTELRKINSGGGAIVIPELN